jgi:SAM-dependent methyltransferase
MNARAALTHCQEQRLELQLAYARRFGSQRAYRDAVWKVLTAEFFQKFIPPDATLLDLGCGWGEFINNITARKKYAIDLNPDAKEHLGADIQLFEQNCSDEWPFGDGSLDIVFTSNFFEHLPSRDDLRRTLAQMQRCVRPGGRIICLGPNIRYLPGAYWDFWDHYLPLTERSLAEALELAGFHIERSFGKFLPYRMAGRRRVPPWVVRLYLKMPWMWHFFGKQFLVIATK